MEILEPGSFREKETNMKLKLLAASILFLCTTLPSQAASVHLAWNPSPGRSIAGYKIHYGLQSGKYTHVVRVKGRLATKAVIKGLREGKTYFFAVSAYNKRGRESALSTEISGKPGEKTPLTQNHATPAPQQASPPSSKVKIPPRTLQTAPGGKILPTR
jgi:YHS domain-containing protein